MWWSNGLSLRVLRTSWRTSCSTRPALSLSRTRPSLSRTPSRVPPCPVPTVSIDTVGHGTRSQRAWREDARSCPAVRTCDGQTCAPARHLRRAVPSAHRRGLQGTLDTLLEVWTRHHRPLPQDRPPRALGSRTRRGRTGGRTPTPGVLAVFGQGGRPPQRRSTSVLEVLAAMVTKRIPTPPGALRSLGPGAGPDPSQSGPFLSSPRSESEVRRCHLPGS